MRLIDTDVLEESTRKAMSWWTYDPTKNFLMDALSRIGIVPSCIEIESNPMHYCPTINIEGHIDIESVKNSYEVTVKDFIGKTKTTMEYYVKKVIFNPPATIILWADGTKTVIKCGENEEFDPEKGLVMAITKKLLGNKGNYYNIIKNLLKEAEHQYNDDVYDPNIPMTVAKRMRGKRYEETYFECPVCGDEILKSGARYCANCGQRLIWEEK